MRVPVRRLPETRVSERQQGFARPVDPLDVSPIRQLAEGFRDQLLDEQDDRQRVELNRRLMQEVNDLQSDFETRRRDPEISPIDFASNTNTAYTERHTALLGELRQQGYSQDLLDDFDGRLGTVRQGFFERGLGHQMVQLRARAGEEIERVGVAASQYAGANPDGYTTARDMLEESIRLQPDLMEDEREQLLDQQLAILRDSAGRALVIQDPQFIIDTLDPQGLTAPYSRTTPSTSGATPTAAAGWQGVATNVATELGLDPIEVAAVMSYETGGSFSPSLMGGTGGNYMGLIQFGPEERRTYGITASSTPEEWTAAILNFMRDRGFRRGMSLLDFYSTINAGSPGRYEASDSPGNTVRTHLDRLLREHRGNAERWLGRAERPVETASVQVIDLPPSSSRQQSDSFEPGYVEPGTAEPTAEPSGDISSIRTGNALLDDLTGSERLQLLGKAREQMNRVTATQRAEMDVTIGNITAQMGSGIATPIPTREEVLQIYGPIEGPQRYAQIEQAVETDRAMQSFATQSATDIQRALDALEPEPGSPTYAAELPAYQAAQRAAQALITAREQDPAAYAMQHFPAVREAAEQSPAHYYAALDRVYETLGIDPSTAPVMSGQAIEQLTEQYRDMNSSQIRQFFRQHMSEMGVDRFRRFVRDMEGTTAEIDARIFELLRTYPGLRGSPVQNLYHQILEGREFIQQDPTRRPRTQQVLGILQSEDLAIIRSPHLHARTSQAIQEAAEGLYVQRGGDPVTVDPAQYREALRTVLGGSLPADMTHGQAREFTILPPGSNERQFQAWIERQTWQSLTEASVDGRPPRYSDLRTLVRTEDIINEGVFVMVAPGQYIIRMGQDGRALATSTGRPFKVNIDPREVLRAAEAPRRARGVAGRAM